MKYLKDKQATSKAKLSIKNVLKHCYGSQNFVNKLIKGSVLFYFHNTLTTN